MKKHLLLLSAAALLFTGTANAQIPNAGFETWNPDPINGSAMDPNDGTLGDAGWQTLNVFSSAFTGGSPISVFEENSIIHSGSHSCKITSVQLTGTSYNYIKSFLPKSIAGIAITGAFVATPSPALKVGVMDTNRITNRITSFNFFYQYYPTSTDTAFCSVVLSHTTFGSGYKRNTIGASITTMTGTGATWKMGTVTIFYDSSASHLIDTITVMFSSSSFTNPHVGSILYVDDASVLAVNNIDAPSASINVYPNPTSGVVNFNISPSAGSVAGYNIEVYDITGKKVNTYKVTNNLTTINTDAYSSGLYFYQLYDQSGAQLKVGKFSVVK
ncbi:MAG TPA: T9SS type A sorting domain-containing protein [Bacteroidia bacterium]|jgi:hypothetical protein|nr:T9SS type A sorting domain-containing protein [Bacteroidia bacterium]